MNDLDYMKLALELAEKGVGLTSPNPLVGAVIVKDDRIIGQGWHKKFGEAHAEVNALNSVEGDAGGATMFVTLEPCSHHGNTPPCVERLIAAGISRVVIALQDPNPRVNGNGIERLRRHQIKVDTGVLEQEARIQNESFIKFITTGLPFVTVKCAATLDGMIATRTGDAKWMSNECSRRFVHQMRQAVDAIMVGVNTVNADNPQLTTRLNQATTKDPIRVILDTRLSIDSDAKLLHLSSDAPTWIITGETIPEKKRRQIENENVAIIPTPLVNGQIDLSPLIRLLGQRQVSSLLIEGGGQVIGSSLRAGIVDKVALFYTPRLLGGNDGTAMVAGKGAENAAGFIELDHTRLSSFDGDILVEGYIRPGMNHQNDLTTEATIY